MIHTEYLPRVVYIGDVQVEETFAGMLFLHRILWNYPRDRLLIVEGQNQSNPSRRIPGVRYERLWMPLQRGLRTRFVDWVAAAHTLGAPVRLWQVPRCIRDFRPEAVLTVAWQYSWIAAAAFARRTRLPLHLICHDDWPYRVSENGIVRRLVDARFADAYRGAASRLCVSPLMATTYEERYGATGGVLYPMRAPHEPSGSPPRRLLEVSSRPTAVYLGSAHGRGTIDALQLLASALAEKEGRILVFGPDPPNLLRELGLEAANVELRGFVEREKLTAEVRQVADFLFVTSSFREEDRMALSFPSKLTDCTALGLPMLLRGPPGCALVHWARAHPECAEIVERDGFEPLRNAVARLVDAPRHRWQLACNALEIGEKCFAHRVVEGVILAAIRGGDPVTVGAASCGSRRPGL